MTLPHVVQGAPHVDAHNAERDVINSIDDLTKTGRLSKGYAPPYSPREALTGPVATDTPTVTTGAAADALFNKTYITASATTLPAIWPFDCWGVMSVVASQWVASTSNPAVPTVATFRFVTDALEFLLYTRAAGYTFDVFIDGKPYSGNPVTAAATTGITPFGIQKFVFGSAKPRLVEIRGAAGIWAVSVKNPYRVWKPAPDSNPRVAVVGDSYVYPTTLNDASGGIVATGYWELGLYQGQAKDLGITSMVTDGIAGTGYINPGPGNMQYTHATRRAWLTSLNPKPDVIVMHGGGSNDIYYGSTDVDIIAAATDQFTWLRTNFPNAKLVFVEGFTPPGFTPATYGPRLIAIRTAVQANLLAAGVDAYFVKVASASEPPIFGSGYVTAANGTGNSDIYVGSDTFHLTVKGNLAMRGYLTPKFRAILADNGRLVNTLI